MNFAVLDPKVQDYIRENEHTNIAQLILKRSPFAGITAAEIAQQIEARKKPKRNSLLRTLQSKFIFLLALI